MGGGLAFLTKKSFNPANWSNQRQVWEARQNNETEKRRIAERDEQLKREREEEELARVVGGEEGGGRKALGFMYDAGKVPGLDRKQNDGISDNDGGEYDGGDKQSGGGGGEEASALYERQPGDDDAAAAFRALLARGTAATEGEPTNNISGTQYMTAGEAALKDDGIETNNNAEEDETKDKKPDHRTNLEKAVGRGINAGSNVTLAQQMERFPQLKGAPMALQKPKGGVDNKESSDSNVASLNFKPLGAVLRNVQCLKCGKWGHSRGDRECEVTWNPFNMSSSMPTAPIAPPAAAPAAAATANTTTNNGAPSLLDEGRNKELCKPSSGEHRNHKKESKRRRKEERKHRKKKHKSHKRRKRSRYYSSDDSSVSSYSSEDSDSRRHSKRHRYDTDSDDDSRRYKRSRKESKRKSKHHSKRRHHSPSLSASLTILAMIGAHLIVLGLLGVSSAFNYSNICSRQQHKPSICRLFGGELLARSEKKLATTTAADALALINEAKALRAEASMLQQQLNLEKEERIRKECEKVDNLIDALLFHGSSFGNDKDDGKQERSKQQLLQTEEQVAKLLISKRLNYEMVNQVFDRICELSNRPQSIDSCSPLLSLLLDAACQVDVIERKDNPNKRWNGRVERDLRRKLFGLGYGIRIEDVENEKRSIRSITGEKDLY